ncbi:MAG TPA: argininosuccinate lyase [Pyrinomonadaceae bacterium]|nr:argininosuccinate lyase [Pyrinomonadaceae bacterium]
MSKGKKLWGGRFKDEADPQFAKFNSSFAFDRRLFAADIRGSVAHCHALQKAGVISQEESQRIVDGLNALLYEASHRDGYFAHGSEDVHSFVEARLHEHVGELAGKLHTGRSRNDQVATDLRLWMREGIDQLSTQTRELQKSFIDIAAEEIETVMPGYTHLQRAQPILFAHWCLAYFEMLARDRERLGEVRRRVNVLPLGSAAIAGTSFPIDRQAVAAELEFETVSANSIDAVSDRDFCVEFASACSLIMVHLSRLAEEIILYSSAEFGFFELSDAVATGSSLMPQKKNPDAMELVRGKAGRVFGDLMALLTTLKGLPLAYNKDMQEDKEAVFDAFDTTLASLEVSAIVLKNLIVNRKRTTDAASKGMLNATELADYLVHKGVPFREAHDTVGKAVLTAMAQNVELAELSLTDLQKLSTQFDADVYQKLTLEQTLLTKSAVGGTSPERVAEALEKARTQLESKAD